MTTSIQPRQEVFPGYELAERIGSGGYAEVWRARAPGGIDKAVKIVFGCYDDQLAVQELKSLERIKCVRHPFVLSLERFEIVDGRLAILTELADMSLEQRAQQCRTQGLPGIPREELLQFISDTAEALDFLAERHSLLHLDIKPANLLISGDHVKVADFGLVKELASCTQNSMVAGMTPTYSSPEMFDDAPSPFSDQYSLAIVYQEMLTGVLPFPGRTTAQLANQHLRSQPQLAALNEADRPHVARALAKNPVERFASCREFVRALKGAAAVAATCGVASKPNDLIETSSSDRSHSDRATADCSTQQRPHGSIDTKSDVKPAPKAPPEVIVDIEVPEVKASTTTPPTLYVAVGGVGIRILNRLRDRLALRANSQNAPAVEMMAVDTDRAELKTACSSDWTSPLSSADTLFLPLKLPQVYRDQGSNLEWLSHRWLYNIPRSLETRSYRPLGRLALVDHADKVLQLIDRKLSQLGNGAASETPAEPAVVRVVLIAGMAGGTGGGMAIDLANAVRSRVVQSARRAQVHGLFVCTCLGNASVAPLAVANTVAVLNELRHVSASGNLGAKVPSGSSRQFESQQRPFDLAYVVKAVHNAEQATDDGLDLIAKQLALALTSGAGQVLETCQLTATPRELARAESLLLRTFGSAPLAGPKQNRIDRLARSLAKTIEQRWLTNAAPSEWRRLERLGEAENMLNRANSSNPSEGSAKTKAAPEAPPQPPAIRLRERFGKQSTTQFAHEVVSRLCNRSPQQGETANTSSSSNSEKFIECALQAITTISKGANQSVHSEALSEEDDIILNKLSASDHSLLTKLIDEIEQMSADFTFDSAKVDRIVTAYCVAAVEEFLGLAAGGSNSATHADAQHALARADVDLLQCGYDRRTIIFVPSQNSQSAAPDAVADIRPQAAKITAEVDEPIVFCEGSGISPASLTRGFERVYPGIAEAAGRLFTRIDIDWS